MMVDAGQNRVETFGNLMQVLQGQFTFIQLTVCENIVDNPLHQALQASGGGLKKRPGGSLHCIGQQDQPGLFGLGLGSMIPVGSLIDLRHLRVFLIFGLLVEKRD